MLIPDIDMFQMLADLDLFEFDDTIFNIPPEPLAQPPPVATQSNPNLMKCPVSGCTSAGFTKPVQLRRHWGNTHFPMVLMYRCIVEGCSYENVRDDKVREHCTSNHFNAFKDDTDRKNQLKNLCQVLLPNRRFIDPKGAEPPARVGIVLSPRISPDARVTKIAAVHTAKVLKENVAPQLSVVDAPTSMLETPLPAGRNELIKEHFLIQHKLQVLQKRDNAIRAALKKMEEQETVNLKRRIEELEQETRANREELREKDRKIRRLEGGNTGY